MKRSFQERFMSFASNIGVFRPLFMYGISVIFLVYVNILRIYYWLYYRKYGHCKTYQSLWRSYKRKKIDDIHTFYIDELVSEMLYVYEGDKLVLDDIHGTMFVNSTMNTVDKGIRRQDMGVMDGGPVLYRISFMGKEVKLDMCLSPTHSDRKVLSHSLSVNTGNVYGSFVKGYCFPPNAFVTYFEEKLLLSFDIGPPAIYNPSTLRFEGTIGDGKGKNDPTKMIISTSDIHPDIHTNSIFFISRNMFNRNLTLNRSKDMNIETWTIDVPFFPSDDFRSIRLCHSLHCTPQYIMFLTGGLGYDFLHDLAPYLKRGPPDDRTMLNIIKKSDLDGSNVQVYQIPLGDTIAIHFNVIEHNNSIHLLVYDMGMIDILFQVDQSSRTINGQKYDQMDIGSILVDGAMSPGKVSYYKLNGTNFDIQRTCHIQNDLMWYPSFQIFDPLSWSQDNITKKHTWSIMQGLDPNMCCKELHDVYYRNCSRTWSVEKLLQHGPRSPTIVCFEMDITNDTQPLKVLDFYCMPPNTRPSSIQCLSNNQKYIIVLVYEDNNRCSTWIFDGFNLKHGPIVKLRCDKQIGWTEFLTHTTWVNNN